MTRPPASARIAELERNEKISVLRLTYEGRASAVGYGMFVYRGCYEVAKARGVEYFAVLNKWKASDGADMYVVGFADRADADIRGEFGDTYSPTDESGRTIEFMSVSQFRFAFEWK
jgi:hypothetical protein